MSESEGADETKPGPVCWVGIDEAGYGPNLGPLVMTAVVATTPDDRPPDRWTDLGPTVARAGGDPAAFWVDDSKALYRPGQGRDRLDAACLALLAAVSATGEPPATLSALLGAVGAGTLAEAELTPWLDGADPTLTTSDDTRARLAQRPFDRAPWRVVAVRSVVVAPATFNARLDALESNKARVHFEAFAQLVRAAWSAAPADAVTRVRGDKHGGRHFYLEPLVGAFPDAWIDRGVEGPELSRYVLRDGPRRLELSLQPRADAADGLVALASVVSKSLREFWMDAFNAYWVARRPGLRPTAGYPVDSHRFRRAIADDCATLGLPPDAWWRRK